MGLGARDSPCFCFHVFFRAFCFFVCFSQGLPGARKKNAGRRIWAVCPLPYFLLALLIKWASPLVSPMPANGTELGVFFLATGRGTKTRSSSTKVRIRVPFFL